MRREILDEFTRVGRTVRVAAVDAETGREAVVMGPVTAGEAALADLARRKLERLLSRDGAG